MKRSRYFLGCVVSILASTGAIVGQGTVSFGLNLSPVAPALPDGAAAGFGAQSSSGIFAGIATLRTSDPLLTINPGWSAGTTGPGVNSGPAFGPDAISVRIGVPVFGTFDNMSSGALIHPDVVTTRPSDSFMIVRVWDSLPPSDSGWAMAAATGRPGLFLDRGAPPNFQVQPTWGGLSGGVGLKIQEESNRMGGAFPPIPPLPSNRDSGRESGLVVVPEPSTWALIGVGAAALFHGRRRRP